MDSIWTYVLYISRKIFLQDNFTPMRSFNKHSISYLQPWSKYKHNLFGMDWSNLLIQNKTNYYWLIKAKDFEYKDTSLIDRGLQNNEEGPIHFIEHNHRAFAVQYPSSTIHICMYYIFSTLPYPSPCPVLLCPDFVFS